MVEKCSTVLNKHVELKFDATHVVSFALKCGFDKVKTTAVKVLLVKFSHLDFSAIRIHELSLPDFTIKKILYVLVQNLDASE